MLGQISELSMTRNAVNRPEQHHDYLSPMVTEIKSRAVQYLQLEFLQDVISGIVIATGQQTTDCSNRAEKEKNHNS